MMMMLLLLLLLRKCICCTLRGDLLKTVKSLSEEGKFDYLVIESTGIGEPLPVAQTFIMDVDQMESTAVDADDSKDDITLTVATDSKKSLFHYAKLDTLVTVVDALNIYNVLTSIETLADKDNISGMLGNTGADDDENVDLAERYPGGKEAMEEKKKVVLDTAMAMSDNQLRQFLEDRELDTTGSKEELVNRIVAALEKQLLDSLKTQKDDRSIAKLWLDQIEFANVIVISKATQLLEGNGNNIKQLKEIEDMIKKLNPGAQVIIPTKDKYGDLDVSKTLINTGLFDMEKASSSASWIEELEAEDHNPETLEYGISSTTYVADHMPFHPERLHKVLMQFGDWFMALKTNDSEGSDSKEAPAAFKGLVRTKGQVWLANSHAYPLDLHTAGKHFEIHPSEEPFIVEKKDEDLTESDIEGREWMKENGWWTEEWGDHRSRLIFIGVDLNAEEIHQELNKALLTKEESEALGGQKGWKDLKDPFYGGALIEQSEEFYNPSCGEDCDEECHDHDH